MTNAIALAFVWLVFMALLLLGLLIWAHTDLMLARRKVKHYESWMQGIIDFDHGEICYDEFAYQRRVEEYREAARAALNGEWPEKVELP